MPGSSPKPPDDPSVAPETDTLRSHLAGLHDPMALLEGLFASSPVPYIIFGQDGYRVANNRAYREMFGREPPPEYNVLRDEVAARIGLSEAVLRAFSGENVQTPPVWYDPKELTHIHVDDAKRVAIATTFFPLRNASGAAAYVAVAFKDVTAELAAREQAQSELERVQAASLEQSRLAQALRDSEERQRATLEAAEVRYRDFVSRSTEGIWRVELEQPVPVLLPALEQVELMYRYAYLAECNDAMARMYGFERAADLVGKRLGELLVRDDPRNAAYLVAFVEHGYRLEAAESHELDRDGQPRVFQNSLVGTIEDGQVVRAWGTQRDVTREIQALQQAEAANRAKDEFLALLGHELRNPLAPILTALELMKLRDAQALPQERAVIERQVTHVVRLVDDLLDVSRITRGKVSLEQKPIDLADVVAAAIELASPLLEQRAHQLTVNVPHGSIVSGDALRLVQVFTNLLSNAAKYTLQSGSVSVHSERSGRYARIVVRDSGIGIRPEILPHVFDLFVQERQALDRSEGGLGLGLAIVRSLIELHEGRVGAHSAGAGQGSEFWVELPTVAAQATAEVQLSPEPQAQPRGLDILVVDDNEDAADLLASLLKTFGHVVHVAYDGPAALELLETFTPDVALLDIGLPAMDGYELARRLRAQPRLSQLRLIAVTGYGQPKDRDLAVQAGFDAHLVKPVSTQSLSNVLAELTA